MEYRERILQRLSEGETVSGEALAEELGMTRAAVWKGVQALRGEGYDISASTNRGYTLRNAWRALTESGIRMYRNHAAATEVYRTLDSTNNRAKELAMRGAESGTLVLADAQTQGRGRFGRKFHSPEGMGLYMSLLLRPKMPAEQAVRVTILAAVAAAQAVEALSGGHVEIKWVNDLYMGGKKVCGILTEAGMDFESGQLEYCVVGLGMNVGAWEYPEEIAHIATSIEEQTGKCVSRNRLAAEIVNRIEDGLQSVQDAELMEEYRRRSCALGRHVTVYRGNDIFDAIAEEIADDGALLVRASDGAKIALRSGEVSLKIRA